MENDDKEGNINRYERKTIVYTVFSKHYYFAKMLVSVYVLENNYIPLNPFNNWGYFMDDMVDRDLVVRGNNNLFFLADEVWTFGPIADGVFAEVKLANSRGIPVRYFSVGKKLSDIQPIENKKLVFEQELLQQFEIVDIYKEFGIYIVV